MGKAVGAQFGYALLEGTGTLAVDLTGEGGTEDSILASLAGKIEIDMPEGARLGVDVDALAAAAAANSLDGGWGIAARGATAVDNLSAHFLASRGLLTSETLKANAGERAIMAAGSVNVAERALDLRVTRTGALARDGGLGEAAPAQTFRVNGHWDAPSIRSLSQPDKAALPAGPGTDPRGVGAPRADDDRG
jgi:uncharacterized protein involved in outer membrane biogenesis